MDLMHVLTEENIVMQLKGVKKDEVLRELIRKLYDNGSITDEELFLKDVYEREKLGITGIGSGIAIPHGKSDAVKQTVIAIGKSKENLEWESLDDSPVNIVILFAVRDDDRETVHIKLLSKVASVLGDDEACLRIMEAKTKEELINVFSEKELD